MTTAGPLAALAAPVAARAAAALVAVLAAEETVEGKCMRHKRYTRRRRPKVQMGLVAAATVEGVKLVVAYPGWPP